MSRRIVNVLALDLGHNCGFAVDDPTSRLGCRLDVAKFKSHYPDTGATFVEIEQWLEMMISTYAINVLCWEAPIIVFGKGKGGVRQNMAGVEFAYGFQAIADLVGTRRGLQTWAVSMITARKHFTGNAYAKKENVRRRAALLGYDVEGLPLDATDAVAIYDYARHFLRQKMLTAGPLFAEKARVHG